MSVQFRCSSVTDTPCNICQLEYVARDHLYSRSVLWNNQSWRIHVVDTVCSIGRDSTQELDRLRIGVRDICQDIVCSTGLRVHKVQCLFVVWCKTNNKLVKQFNIFFRIQTYLPDTLYPGTALYYNLAVDTLDSIRIVGRSAEWINLRRLFSHRTLCCNRCTSGSIHPPAR